MISVGMTFVLSPPRTTVGVAVLWSSGSSDSASFPNRSSSRSGQRRDRQRPQREALVRRKGAGHRAEHLADDRDEVNGQAALLERREEPAELLRGRVADDGGGMDRPAADRRADEAPLLLGDLDRIETPPADPLGEASDLAERVAHPLEELRRAPRRGTSPPARCRSPRRWQARGRGRRRARAASAAARRNAATSIATPPFMSSAPLPHTSPSTSSPANGGWLHSSALAGTTSTCP